MKISVCCVLALVAVTSGKELKAGPQIFSESQKAISGPPQKTDKRYVSEEYTLYLTPSEIKALQKGQSSETAEVPGESLEKAQEWNLQNYNDKFSEFIKYSKSEPKDESQEKKKEEPQILFYFNDKPVYHNQDKTNEFSDIKQIVEEEPKPETDSQKEGEYKWFPYNSESSQKQEESYIKEQVQKQWNRYLDESQVQLKGISTASKEGLGVESYDQDKKLVEVESNVEKEEEQKSEIEKEIEKILKNNEKYASEKGFDQEESDYQSPPVVIHKEVSITKHLPVHVIKKVKVPVPKPVLVPVPEPYHVKVPHPYPVPVEIVKHVPVPVVRHY